jgi:hypothetical protein
VIAAAQRFLTAPPVTITAFPARRSAGGSHDFFSEGDYWWPDPQPDYLSLWKTLKSDSNVEEVVRNFFIRQPLLWLD